MSPHFRQVAETLPPALVVGGALTLAVQMLGGGDADERLLRVLAPLAAAEAASGFLDGVLTEFLEKRLAGRVIGLCAMTRSAPARSTRPAPEQAAAA